MDNIYVSFHIKNGKLTFHTEEDFQQLLSRCSDTSTIINCDDNGNPLADSEWQLIDDANGIVLLEGREEIEARIGRIEWDTIYDTDYVTTTDNLSKAECDALWNAYMHEVYMTEALQDIVCHLAYKCRVHSIKRYPTNLIVFDQYNHSHIIDFDGQQGEFTREMWEADLAQRDFCPFSIAKILDTLELCGTNAVDFFADIE